MKIIEVAEILKRGGIGVMPTDTVYGLVGSAFSRRAVERIYRVRKRDKKKPFIVLISSLSDLRKFGVKVSGAHFRILKVLWSLDETRDKSEPVSVILPVKGKKFYYIHRGMGAIAFRLPRNGQLRGFLKKTGPLVAPSANVAGKPPARTIAEAKKYFGARIDFYLEGGKKKGAPSSVVALIR